MFNHRISLALSLIIVVFVTACVPAPTAEAPAEAPAEAAPAEAPPAEAPPAEAAPVADSTPETVVAIFVVDKFANVDNQAVEENETYPAGEGCVIDPHGSGFASRGGGDDGEHGRLVWSTITEKLQKEHSASQVSGSRDVDLWGIYANAEEVAVRKAAGDYDNLSQKWGVPNYGLIRLIPVDIGDFDTATVTKGIEEGFASLSAYEQLYGEKITRVVINMSWVIIPAKECGVPQTPEQYKDMVCAVTSQDDIEKQKALESVNQYLSEVGREPINAFEEVCTDTSWFEETSIQSLLRERWLSLRFSNFVSQDSNRESYVNNYLQLDDGPLSTLLTTCQGSEGGTCPVEHVISIAAAGNEGWSFPMMPGLWNSVVSVSAEEGLGQSITDCQAKTVFCSNSAEIKEPGTHPDGVDVGIGSSYAAPRLSVLAALYLLQGGTNPCADRTDIHPPLGYMTEDGDANDSSAWQDLETAAADEKYCGNDFLQ